jgi:hypothetical protein
MYVHIQRATPDQLQFSLNSDGRFVGFIKDAFYTGQVIDPHTGRTMLDRELERRLALAGRDRTGKRHADLLMRAYPWLREKLGWDVRQRVAFLDKCLRVCPQSDEAWLAFAELVKRRELPAAQKEVIRSHLTPVLTRFQNYPDFVSQVYGDLLAAFEPGEQVRLYQQAVALFERAGRPDLSCDARLRITDALAEQKKWQAAADGLVTTINRFPTEGRFVPKMTLKMQQVCAHYKGGNDRLARLYLDLVPKLAAYYGSEDSKYTQELSRQALDYFEQNQMHKYAAALRARAALK